MPSLSHTSFLVGHTISTVAIALCLLPASVGAQTLYKNVDANGRVTYSDRPTTAGAANASSTKAMSTARAATDAPVTGLPYSLQQVVQRYPVRLYTRDNCEPCDEGRALLRTRGIPFQEFTVNSERDATALERLSGHQVLPLLTVGSQQIKGYSDLEWSRYLDAAGYPPNAVLPRDYQQAPARPLVAQSAPPAPTAAPVEAGQAPSQRSLPAPPPATGPTPENPAGIRF